VLQAVVYILREGCRWRALPVQWGHWNTLYRGWRRWVDAGLWAAVLGRLARRATGRLRFVDSTFIKVHQAGHGARGGSKHQAIGLTKGGVNSKLTAAVDERGKVVALLLFPGQCAETIAAKALLPLLAKTMIFVGDKGFDSDELRDLIEDRGGLACIPPRSNRTSYRWSDPDFYRHRHLVENIFQRLKVWRRVATRYEKLASTFLAFATLATSIHYLR
jgi:transposase